MVLCPYWANIRRWISTGFTPSAQRNRTTPHWSSMVQSCKGASTFSPSLLPLDWRQSAEPTWDGEFPQVSLLLLKETALRHIVLRWCNLAKEHPRFRSRCCHSTEDRVLYCTWLNSSTGIVNTAQCDSSSLSRLPRNLKIAFTFLYTLVYIKRTKLKQSR